jgi:predicted ATPase
MIKQLTLTNFKGVKQGTVTLDPLTILLGSNNAAKSTILEAIFLGTNPFRPTPYYIHGLSLEYPSNALETVLFLHKTLDYQGYAFLLRNYTENLAKIEFTLDKPIYDNSTMTTVFVELVKQNNRIFFHSNAPNFALNTIRIGGLKIQTFGEASLDSSSHQGFEKRPLIGDTLLINPKLVQAGYEYLRREWARIVNSRISRKIAREISKLSPEQYIDFTMEPIIGGQLDINAYLEDGRRIRLGDLGEGIQSYLLTRLLYEITDPKMLLWDDMESHLNPKMLITLASWFKELIKMGKQVIVSTHSLELAEVVGGVNEEDTRISLSTLRDSKLEVKRISLEELVRLKQSGIDARTSEALL